MWYCTNIHRTDERILFGSKRSSALCLQHSTVSNAGRHRKASTSSGANGNRDEGAKNA